MIEDLRQNSPRGGGAESKASGNPGSGESEKQSIFSAYRTTILMGLAFLAGLSWIVMAKWNMKPFTQSDVELSNSFMVEMGVRDMKKQLPDSSGKLDPEVDRMVKAFYVKTSEKQIPVNELKKNPFMQYVPYVPEEEDKVKLSEGEQSSEGDKVQGPSTEGLKLQMILVGGGVKSATISGFVMHEGDIVNGWKILEIKQDQVVIENNGKKHVLSRNLRPMVKPAATEKQ